MKSDDVDEFLVEHETRKHNGMNRRRKEKGRDAEKRIHSPERKQKWKFNPNAVYDEDE